MSFLDGDFDPGFTYDLNSGSATSAGMYDSNYTQVSGSFSSASSGCSACSYLTHRAEQGWIDALVLDSDEPADVTWATTPLVTPDRFRIALFSPIEVTQVGWNHYRAESGTASFVLSMSDVAFQPVLWATNVNAIDIKRDNATAPWKIEPFKLEYTDSEDNVWGIYVQELIFE